MSLHAAAQHLKAQGRGPDDQLVHMSGQEVRSLQQLAKAYGGSMTTNPHTGLPEAGFLDSIMPTVIGAGVGIATGNPMLGAAAAGMYGYGQSGSLTQGLMAGLAGYGGAGLTSGITPNDLGFTSGAATSPGALPPVADVGTAVQTQTPAWDASQPFKNPNLSTYTPVDVQPTYSTPPTDIGPPTSAASMGPPKPSPLDRIQSNFSADKKLGLYAAAPVIADAMKPPTLSGLPTTTGNQKQVAPYYKYNPGKAMPTPTADPQGRENTYFPTAGYEQISLADANKLYGTRYADGGDVSSNPYEWSDDQNSVVRMADGGAAPVNPNAPENSISSAAVPSPDFRDYLASSGDSTGATASTGSNNGSPTGTGWGDAAMAISSLGMLSPIAAALADAALSAFSSTSPTSVNAVNGMDAASDAASAAGGADGEGSDSGGGGGGSSGEAGAAAGGAGPGGPGDGGAGSGGAGGGGGDGGEARGGLSPHFEYHMAKGGLSDSVPGFASGMFLPIGDVMNQLKAQGAFDAPAKKYTYNPEEQEYTEAMANGGLSAAHYNLGGYSDGGRLLKGPGDGVSDSIPAVIGHKQPARLADGEFVVPARIVSEIGNGSTEAGARKLYAMMDRVQKARRKTVGKNKVATNTKADKYLPA